MRALLCLFALLLFVSACAAEEEGGYELEGFRPLTAADLVHKSFRFGPDAGLFEPDDPRFGQTATLIVGEVYEKTSTAGFALTTDDGSVQGGMLSLGSCLFDTTFLQLAAQEPQSEFESVFFYCGVDDVGRLGLLEDEEVPPVISEPPTEPAPDLDALVTLSPEAVVDPRFDPATRAETGTAELRLFGNVLSYSVTVEDLSPGDEISDGHVRLGAASENGELLFTLFGSPIQPERMFNPPFIEGTSITASIFLTPAEVATLSDSGGPIYVQLTSLQELGGLLRGQLGTATIGPDGGVFAFPNGVVLDIPAGALSETIDISVKSVPMDELRGILSERRADVYAKRRMVGAFRIEPVVAFSKAVTVTLPVKPPEPGEIWRRVDIEREARKIWPVPTDLRYFAERGVVEMKLPPATAEKRHAAPKTADKQAPDGTEHGAEGHQWDYEGAERRNNLDEQCKIAPQPPECEALDPLQPACCSLKDVPETCKCCRHEDQRAQSSASEASRNRGTEVCEIFTDAVTVEYYACVGQDGQQSPPETHAMGAISEDCPEDLELEVEIISPSDELFICKTQEYDARIRGVLPDGTEVIAWQSFDPIWKTGNPKVAKFIENPVTVVFDGTLEGIGEGTTKVWAFTGIPEEPYATTSEVEVRSHISEFTLTPPALLLTVEHSRLVSATVVKYDSTALDASSVRWQSADPTTASAAPSTAPVTRVEGVRRGCTEIEAKYTYEACEDVAETVQVCVDCPLVTLIVSPDSDNVAIDGVTVISAEASTSEGPVDVSGVQWTSSDSRTVERTPEFGPSTGAIGRGPGRATITALYTDDCNRRVASSVIYVCPEIAFEPDYGEVDVEATVTLDLVALDHAGDPMAADLSGAAFDVRPDDVAEIALGINQRILVKGLAAGTATVTATFNGGCGTQVAQATVIVQDDTVTGEWNVQVVGGEQSCDIDGDVFYEDINSGDEDELVDLEQVGESLTVSYREFPAASPYAGTIAPTGDPLQPYRINVSVDSSETIDCIRFFETDGAELHYGQAICPEDTAEAQWTCQARSCNEYEHISGYVMPGSAGFVGETTWQFDGRGNAIYVEPPNDPVVYENVPITCTGEARLIGCRGGSPDLQRALGTCITTEDAKAVCVDKYGEEPDGAACLPGEFADNIIACLYCR